MLTRFTLAGFVGALIGAVLLTAAQAAPITRNTDRVFTTKAKIAYYYSRDGGVDKSKNVAEFTHPSTGVFCIVPSVKFGYPNYPHVTVDWGNSVGGILLAYIYVQANDCPGEADAAFEVLTYDGSGNRSDNVSFIFSLP